jgi:hypothetical protein
VSRRRQIRRWLRHRTLNRWALAQQEAGWKLAEMAPPEGDPYWPHGGKPTARINNLADDQEMYCRLDKLRAKNWRQCYICGRWSNVEWATGMCREPECLGYQQHARETLYTDECTRMEFGC